MYAQYLVNILTKNLTCKIKVAEIIRIKSVVGRKGDPVFDHPWLESRACNYFVEPSEAHTRPKRQKLQSTSGKVPASHGSLLTLFELAEIE